MPSVIYQPSIKALLCGPTSITGWEIGSDARVCVGLILNGCSAAFNIFLLKHSDITPKAATLIMLTTTTVVAILTIIIMMMGDG